MRFLRGYFIYQLQILTTCYTHRWLYVIYTLVTLIDDYMYIWYVTVFLLVSLLRALTAANLPSGAFISAACTHHIASRRSNWRHRCVKRLVIFLACFRQHHPATKSEVRAAAESERARKRQLRWESVGARYVIHTYILTHKVYRVITH